MASKSAKMWDGDIRPGPRMAALLLAPSPERIAFTDFSQKDLVVESLSSFSGESGPEIRGVFAQFALDVSAPLRGEPAGPQKHSASGKPNDADERLNAAAKEHDARRDLLDALNEAIPSLTELFGDDVSKYRGFRMAISRQLHVVDSLTPFERRESLRILAEKGEDAFGAYLAKCELHKQPILTENGKKVPGGAKKECERYANI